MAKKAKTKNGKTKSGKTKVPRRKKMTRKGLSGATIFMIIIVYCFIAFRFPISQFVRNGLAEMNGRWGPTGEVEEKKVKKVKKKKAKVVVEQEIAEELYVERTKVQEELPTGELKHHSFTSVVKAKCFSCHGEGEELEGEFNFKKFLASGSTSQRSWAKIYKAIAKGEMPPEEEQPLSEDEKDLLLSSIKSMTSTFKVSASTRPLTPNEIQNTLVDLFDIDTADYNPFSTLYSSYSNKEFYTGQKSMLTPYYLKQLYHVYYDVIENFVGLKPQLEEMQLATKLKRGIHSSRVFKSHFDMRFKFNEEKNEVHYINLAPKKYDRQDRKSGKDISDEQKKGLDAMTLPPGTYTITFKAASLNLESSQWNQKAYGPRVVSTYESLVKSFDYGIPIKFFISPPGHFDAFATEKPIQALTISDEGEEEYKIEFTLTRRSMITFRLDAKFPGDGGLANMISQHQFGDKHERKTAELMKAKYLDKAKYDLPMVRLKDMKIKGPYNVQLHSLSFAPDTKVTTTEVGGKFRKLHELLGLKNNIIYSYIFKDFQIDKLKYEDAYRNAMTLFLMSPPFLQLNNDRKDPAEFARFASYALHKSAPSKEFTEVYTKARRARKSEELAKWLIDSGNFRRFINDFSYQWLEMGEIKNNIPDEQDFSVFYAKNLTDAYRVELELFMTNLFKENRPVRELVDANYSFLNEGLKDFYSGYDTRARLRGRELPPEILEKDFIKTEFSDPQRGGILGMGAFLTSTGNGVDPLPIKRSTWILENLLDTHLPPPPDDIDLSKFEVDKTNRLKDRLASHSQDRACYSCHKKIDPFAIVMDYYDTIGGLNNNYSADAVRINTQKIRGIDELKVYLSFYEPTIARSFCKKLLVFMLGRELGIKDESKLDAIVNENSGTGFKTADLYRSIVKHYFL